MNRIPKYVNFKMKEDDSTSYGGGFAPRPTWTNSVANEDFLSGHGTPIKKGDKIYIYSKQGYPILAKEDMVVRRLKYPNTPIEGE